MPISHFLPRKLSPWDGAKLLDFGLAKLRAAELEAGVSAVATESEPLTGEGTILGTFQYMAPEQLEGKEADARTDIFAFGAVVYEMVTGKKAFEGQSQASLIGAILKDEPPSISELQPLSPSVLEHVVGVCLAKDPDRRWRSAGDVELELQWVVEGGPDDGTASELVASRRASWWVRGAIVGAVIGAAAAGLAFWALMVGRTTEPSPTTTRLTITLPHSHQLPSRGWGRLIVSPDGQTVVYNPFGDAGKQLFQRPINQFEGVPIMHTERAGISFFSPDGQWVGFWSVGALWKVALVGGPSQELTKFPGIAYPGASWETNGMIIIGSPRGLVQIPAAGGELVIIAEREGDGVLSHPQVLPGTGAILYTVSEPSPVAGELQVLLPETGERRSVLPNAVAGRVLNTGHLVFMRSGALWAVPFDQERLEIDGNPVPVVEGLSDGRKGEGHYAVADNGTLVYVPHFAAPAIEKTLVLVDRQGTVDPVPLPPDSYDYPRFSPDGTRIAVQINTRDGESDISIYELSSNRLRQLTFDGAKVPLWTPDGTQITFVANNALWNIASDFSSEPELLSAARAEFENGGPSSWSPDGRVLFWVRRSGVAQLTRLEGGGVEHGPLPNVPREGWANFSADGEWFSFTTYQTGSWEVYVQPYPLGTGARRRITQEGGTFSIWSRSGRELFYSNDGKLWAVGIETEPTLNWQDPVALFETPWPLNTDLLANYDVTPDGQQFVFVQPMGDESDQHASEIRVVLNWIEELKEKVPIE